MHKNIHNYYTHAITFQQRPVTRPANVERRTQQPSGDRLASSHESCAVQKH